VQNFLQTPLTGFATQFASALSNLNSILNLDSQGITASSQSLSTQISDLQTAWPPSSKISFSSTARSTPHCKNFRCFNLKSAATSERIK